MGEKVFADGVTLRSDPFDPRNPGMPWAWAGGDFWAKEPAVLPARRTMWIENGMVRTLLVDRYWAQKYQGRACATLRWTHDGRLRQDARVSDRRDRSAACSSLGSGTFAPSTRSI